MFHRLRINNHEAAGLKPESISALPPAILFKYLWFQLPSDFKRDMVSILA
jgi:hypothetical protein